MVRVQLQAAGRLQRVDRRQLETAPAAAGGNRLHGGGVKVSIAGARIDQDLVIRDPEGVGHRVHCPVCPCRGYWQRAE